jgi:hypothetical protein
MKGGSEGSGERKEDLNQNELESHEIIDMELETDGEEEENSELPSQKEGLSNDMQPQKNFEPGSIHKEEFRDFWRQELNASDWVMKTL